MKSDYVRTEPTTKVFSGKGIAMMHECKRLLNHSTAAEGLLLARRSTDYTTASSMDAFLVPQPVDTDAHAESDGHANSDDAPDEQCIATEQAHEDPSGVTTEPLTKKRRIQLNVMSDEQPDDATESADDTDDDCHETVPAAITSEDAATTIKDATRKGNKTSPDQPTAGKQHKNIRKGNKTSRDQPTTGKQHKNTRKGKTTSPDRPHTRKTTQNHKKGKKTC